MTSLGDSADRLMASLPLAAQQRYGQASLLGEGGMGLTFQVHDFVLERDVALKIIKEEMAEAPHVRDRFRREVTLLSRLRHPNVVTILDVGFEERPWYFTMEFIKGRSLDELLVAGTLPEARVLELGLGLAEALVAAHEAGVLHRDIKPQNIVIDEDGCPKLIDFGLATVTAAGDLTALTKTGVVVGTAQYLAPELMRGERASECSDVYQVGLCLYEALVGRLPLTGNSLLAAAVGARTVSAPTPSEGGVTVFPATEALIMQAIALVPAERMATAKELRDKCLRALKSVKEGRELAYAPSYGRPRQTGVSEPDETCAVPAAAPQGASFRPRRLLLGGMLLLLFFVSLWVMKPFSGQGQPAPGDAVQREVPLVELVVTLEKRLGTAAASQGADRQSLLADCAAGLETLTEALVKAHPRPVPEVTSRFWPLCMRFGTFVGPKSDFIRRLRRVARESPVVEKAIVACSLLLSETDGNAVLLVQSALAELRQSIVEVATEDGMVTNWAATGSSWEVLQTERSIVDLQQRMRCRGLEQKKAIHAGMQLYGESLGWRQELAVARGLPAVPVPEQLDLLVTVVGWQTRLCGNEGGILDDLVQPLYLMLHSPDVPPSKRVPLTNRLAGHWQQFPRHRTAIAKVDETLDGRYWVQVVRMVEKAHQQYEQYMKKRHDSPEAWRADLRQCYWSYRLACLGAGVEPRTRGGLLQVCRSVLSEGPKLRALDLGQSMGLVAVAYAAVEQLDRLTRPAWIHGEIEYRAEDRAVYFGSQVIHAIRDRRLEGPRHAISRLIARAKHRPLSFRILRSIYRRRQRDFPSAWLAYEHAVSDLDILFEGSPSTFRERMGLYRTVCHVVSKECEGMGDVANLRRWSKAIRRHAAQLNGPEAIVYRRYLDALLIVNEARIAAPALTKVQRRQLKKILRQRDVSDLHNSCRALLMLTSGASK